MAFAGNAPAELRWLANEWELAIPSATFSGIVGDVNHKYGYHLAYSVLPASDYSKKLYGDTHDINVDDSDAVDLSMNPVHMKIVTRRFYDSWKDVNDDRLNYWREIIGTLDGANVIYMDTQSGAQGTSDDSHLWHVHLGGLRCNAHKMEAMKAALSVVKGQSYTDYKNQGVEVVNEQLSTGWPTPVTPDGKPDPRPVGIWMSDLWRYYRDGKGAYSPGRRDPIHDGPSTEYLDVLLHHIKEQAKAANENTQLLLARSPATWSPEDVVAFATQVGNILAKSPDVPLTEADLPKFVPVMIAAYKQAAREGTE